MVLQIFGLFLFYVFADSCINIAGSNIETTIKNAVRIPALLLVFSIVILGESEFRRLVVHALRKKPGLSAWLRELATVKGIIRLIILVLLTVLYAVILIKPQWLHLPGVSIIAGVLFQLFHLVLCRWFYTVPPSKAGTGDESPEKEKKPEGFWTKMMVDGVFTVLFLGFGILFSEPRLILVIIGAALVSVVLVILLMGDTGENEEVKPVSCHSSDEGSVIKTG